MTKDRKGISFDETEKGLVEHVREVPSRSTHSGCLLSLSELPFIHDVHKSPYMARLRDRLGQNLSQH